jgi:Flp pilus assembly protein TadD
VGALLSERAVPALRVAVIVLLALRALHAQWVLADPIRAWQDAVARAPTDAQAQRGLGEALAERGDPRAEAALRRVVELAPMDPAAWSNLAALQIGAGRLEAAEQALAEAARLAPRDARVRDNRGMLLQALGRLDEARREYEAAVAGQPALAQPRINLAALLLRRGERERARQLLDEAAALELDPRDVEAIEALRAVLRRPPANR